MSRGVDVGALVRAAVDIDGRRQQAPRRRSLASAGPDSSARPRPRPPVGAAGRRRLRRARTARLAGGSRSAAAHAARYPSALVRTVRRWLPESVRASSGRQVGAQRPGRAGHVPREEPLAGVQVDHRRPSPARSHSSSSARPDQRASVRRGRPRRPPRSPRRSPARAAGLARRVARAAIDDVPAHLRQPRPGHSGPAAAVVGQHQQWRRGPGRTSRSPARAARRGPT